jgi:HD-GYP domain-containing protein (c-di-GMP phosphodiesterase class II)
MSATPLPSEGQKLDLDSVVDLLRAAAETAGAGIELRAGGEVVPLACALACARCRLQTPAVHVRCGKEVRPGLEAGQSNVCIHGQGIKVAAGGWLVAIAPANRMARFTALVEGLTALGNRRRAAANAEGAVHSLVAAIEAKDPYTRGHCERIPIICEVLGEVLGLDQAMRADLHWAALLHDVGKIGSPDHILKKSGKLTPEEYRIMQHHPVRGDEMLEPLAWLSGARLGVRHHHEHFDGNGYPDRLKGEAIPLIARIVAVADAFDAMTSRRQYRDERGAERALDELKREAGAQFDPNVVEAFVKNFDRLHAALLAAPIPPEGLFASPDVAAAAEERRAA